MPDILNKIIVGAISAVIVYVIYFTLNCIVSFIKSRKAKTRFKERISAVERIDKETIQDEGLRSKKSYISTKNIRALLIILIGCLSLYYSMQCVFYDQFGGFNARYFGEGQIVANTLSDQICATGFQSRGNGRTILQMLQGLFIIIGLICITYGITGIKRKG